MDEKFSEVLARIDAATTQIATNIRALKDKIAGQGLSPEAEAQILSALEAEATKLEGMASDPANPTGALDSGNPTGAAS